MNRTRLIAIMRGEAKGPGAALTRGLLCLAVPFYATAVWLRNATFNSGIRKPRKLPRPVISVGNLTTGGTGKTPTVIALARRLQHLGASPAVLLRGYRASSSNLPGTSDETSVLERELGSAAPVCANPDRHRAGRALLEERPLINVFLLDDGFQHRQLHRDLNILLIDATDPWGGGRLLPRGFLREPVTALSRADAVIITRADMAQPQKLADLNSQITRRRGRPPIAHTAHIWTGFRDVGGNLLPPDHLKRIQVLGVCAVGNPAPFSRMITGHTAHGSETLTFHDHYEYADTEPALIARRARDDGFEAVVTTEKDYVKWQRLGPEAMSKLVVPVYRPVLELRFLDGVEALDDLLRKTLGK